MDKFSSSDVSNLLEYYYYYDPETGQETNNINYQKLNDLLLNILERIEKIERELD